MHPAILDEMSWAMAEVYASVTDQIIINLAKYFPFIKDGEEPKDLFQYQARMLAQMGKINDETIAIIMQNLGGADEALRQSLETAITDALETEEPKLKEAAEKGFLGVTAEAELAPNQMLAFRKFYEQSADHLNLVNTVMLESTQAAYQATVSDVVNKIQRTQSILNASAGEVITGASSWNQAVEGAVRKMVSNGISGLVDHAGRHWTPEAYVAMDVRTTMFNTARDAIWERSEEYGSDLYQVSTHNGARPLCYPWQGKVVSRNDNVRDVEDLYGNTIHVIAQSETSYGQPAGLFGINCRHYPMTFIPGISTLRGEPQDEEENAKTYAESQQQRALERDLRYARRDLAVLKAQGASDEEIKSQMQKVDKANENLDAFCEKTGRHRRKSREATPIKASFPDKDTYNPDDFPTEQRDRMKEFFKGKAKASASVQAMQEDDGLASTDPANAEFIPANTITDATKKATSLGINADYSKYHISVANAVNETAQKIQQEFGQDSLSAIKSIGTFPKGFSTNWKGVYSPKDKSLWLRNVNDENAMKKMEEIASEQYKKGWWSTGSSLHVVRHELGHAIADSLSGRFDLGEINEYRKTIKQQILRSRGKKTSSDFLSEYGMGNTNEFIAESIAEYLDGNPRETARTVVEMIKKGKKQ